MTARSIPPKYLIPPTPPTIHRRLSLSRIPEGLVLSPSIDPYASNQHKNQNTNDDKDIQGVLIKWGVKGEIKSWEGEVEPLVEIGGILGVVRLWDNAYLLVYLPSDGRPLFEGQKGGYEVSTLGNVYSIPIHPELAGGAIAQLQAIQKSLRPKSPRKKSGLKWTFNIPNLKPTPKEASELKHMADETDDSDDDYDDHDGTDGETEYTDDQSRATMSRENLGVAPEADEDPMPAIQDNRKRFSWNQFLPIRKAKPVTAATLVGPEAVVENPGAEEQSLKNGGGDIQDSPSVPESTVQTSTDNKSSGEKPFPSDPPQRRDLETKIIRQITREFSAGSFFYSSNYDLTHSLQSKRRRLASRQHTESALESLLNNPSPITSPKLPTDDEGPIPISTSTTGSEEVIEPDINLPLWRRTDQRFFWNEHLLKEFIDLGLHNYVQPVMQGWVQSSGFSIDGTHIDFVVISRRSRDRAGLRYQRRGIDDEGHVANFVETEMIVRAKVEQKVSMFSFVQIRGSIPLKWSQSPYSMKPPPVLDMPVDQSYSVANLHFNDLINRYGPITIINLSEQNGKEGVVTNGYRDLVQHLDRKELTYIPFDFHAKCHGMKWENISELVKEVDFGKMGYFWSLSNEPLREQSGVFRTNCIDCLDRTNVVQSALARHVLTEMLTQLGLVPAASDIENVFNDVWANNGDTLSLCYAHTSALKGDFVRTGKRDIQGMLNDGISSLSRMFYGAISDFFAQAVISFFLGHRNLGVFSEFLASLESSDVSSLSQMSRVRSAAIETSSARVISENERRLAGWVLLSPEQRGVTLSAKLEEKILLLTSRAIYVVSFNYSLDKVSGFSRIPLGSIVSLQHGAFIISALQEAGRDPKENAGLKITFSTGSDDTRYSTYSIRNNATQASAITGEDTPELEAGGDGPTEFYAFKVLPIEFDDKDQGPILERKSHKKTPSGALSVHEDESSDEEYEPRTPGPIKAANCGDQAGKIVRKIHRAVQKAGGAVEAVEERDIVSLAEAERSTGLFAKMDYAVKRFLWL